MGVYLNPGCGGFEKIIKSKYIDKTGLIRIMNRRIDTTDNLVCISRPRRFGKSFAAKMLCAFYDCTCDTKKLFSDFEISQDDSDTLHQNKYNVLYVDMAAVLSMYNNRTDETDKDVVAFLIRSIREEIIRALPSVAGVSEISACLLEYVNHTSREFVFIIDEWDVIIRECELSVQEAYFDLLRVWFKNNNFTPDAIACAYMTGILPIKKDGSQSAVSDFDEYSVLEPGEFAEYTGFTEDEVKRLCVEYDMDFEKAKKWYDGYSIGDIRSIYNPYSVMEAMKLHKYRSFWKRTSAADAMSSYIGLDIDGISEDVIKLTSKERIRVNTENFQNDTTSFKSKDDVLTLMIHLGYLTYSEDDGKAWIPNNEVMLEYENLLQHPSNERLVDLIRRSEQLLNDTLEGNEKAVAEAVERIRETNYAPQYYNDEQALRYAIKFGYIVCVDRFMKVEELPSGRGLADVVYVPSRDSAYPAIIIELKWDREDAYTQIDDRKYQSVLEGYVGEVVKVGITYDAKSKHHECRICRERI